MAASLDELRKSSVYSAQATVSQLQSDLAALRELDKHSEKLQNRWLLAIVGGGVLTLGALVMGVMTKFANPGVVGGMLVVGVVLLIVGIAFYATYGRNNYEDRRYELLHGVLALLGSDTGVDAPLDVRLDLRKPTEKSKFLRKGRAGHWNVSYYEDPWLKLQGRLLDGTSYQLTVIDHHQHRSRWKTNARGKTKHKTKTKSATSAVLRLRPKNEKYPHVQQISQDLVGAVKLPPWVVLKSLVTTERGMVMKTGTKCDWHVPMPNGKRPRYDGVNMVAMMFLTMYQVLNLSRKITKRSSPQRPNDAT